MPASPAFVIDSLSGLVRFGRTAAQESGRHPLVRALGPALDTAFGLEPADGLPEEIAALAALLAGDREQDTDVGETSCLSAV